MALSACGYNHRMQPSIVRTPDPEPLCSEPCPAAVDPLLWRLYRRRGIAAPTLALVYDIVAGLDALPR